MNSRRIYVLGCGAIGFPLAAFLTSSGKDVVAVRTSVADAAPATADIRVTIAGAETTTPVNVCGLDALQDAEGIFVVTAKAAANALLADRLTALATRGPVVLLQNGLGVEEVFLQYGMKEVYRTVLYFTSETRSPQVYAATAFKPSATGIVRGSREQLQHIVNQLHTPQLPMAATDDINHVVWQKAIVNVVFNSICPLLGADNGLFIREPAALEMADQLIAECIRVAEADKLHLDPTELRQQVLDISRTTDGLLISTLQDLNAGRSTEMDFINLAVVARASKNGLKDATPGTQLLGQLVRMKARLRASNPQS